MREIKFRTWSETLKKYIGTWGIYNHEGGAYQSGPFTGRGQPYINEQFTGLRDKNSKEIWEGDILDYGLIKGYVEFVGIGYSLTRGDHGYILKPRDYLECEVIGNTHENSELLGGTK